MQKEEIKFQTSTVFEGMTSVRSILKGIENSTNDRNITEILYDVSKISKISKHIGYLKAVSERFGFEVRACEGSELEKFTLGNSHGGIIAIAGERHIPALDSSKIANNGFYAMIEGIEDPYNFGYALRSLYACGCDGIILGERNWMNAAGVVCRSSAGASELFQMFRAKDDELISAFKEKDYNIVCADENTENILGKISLEFPILLIIGGERRGISKKLLDSADLKVKIPYAREFKASLSAASATTMFAYEIMRQSGK